MDEPVVVGSVERARHLLEDEHGAAEAQSSLMLQDLPEVASLHVAHRDVEEAVLFSGVVDRDDVRMVERSRQVRLLEKALAKAGVPPCDLGGEELERHLPSEPRLLGEIDHTHAAAAEHRLDPETGYLGADSCLPHPVSVAASRRKCNSQRYRH